jgi:hypothetical protein
MIDANGELGECSKAGERAVEQEVTRQKLKQSRELKGVAKRKGYILE